MRPYTDEMPKALLPIGEKTIIEYLLDNLSASGIRDVVVVVGYGALKVKEKVGSRYKNCSITYVLNEEYATTNNIYSLWLAREHITDGMIFFNGDIVFHQGILSGILSNTVSNSFAADPFSDLQDDAMKVVLRGGRMRKIGKHLAEDANAWAIGIYKLSQEASEAYFREAEKIFERGDKNVSFVVPAENYFVLGDNRPHSSDSRAFGPITKDKITGRAWVIYWPFKNAGLLAKTEYD